VENKKAHNPADEFYDNFFEGDFEFFETDNNRWNRTKIIGFIIVISVSFSLGYCTALFT
jgi:hypothetical protein